MAFWCVFQQGEFKNTIKKLGEIHVKNILPKKLRKTNPVVFLSLLSA
jgi:hypothetical protein